MGQIGYFDLENGEDLDPDCQELYRSYLKRSADTVVMGINNPTGDISLYSSTSCQPKENPYHPELED